VKYAITWKPKAISELAQAYLDARTAGRDTSALRQAVAEVDHLLANDPTSVGESRDGDNRVVIVTPLTVTYVVSAAVKAVSVTHVRYHRPRSN
jgi:hypothetical protein